MIEIIHQAKLLDDSKLGQYKCIYQKQGNHIYKYQIMDDKTAKKTLEYNLDQLASISYNAKKAKVIGLPNEKLFVIGGSVDASGMTSSNKMTELVKDPHGNRTAYECAQMHSIRSDFAVAVYPNF